jgi:hypothetical protein
LEFCKNKKSENPIINESIANYQGKVTEDSNDYLYYNELRVDDVGEYHKKQLWEWRYNNIWSHICNQCNKPRPISESTEQRIVKTIASNAGIFNKFLWSEMMTDDPSFFDSFKTIPIDQISLAPIAFRDLAYWGSNIFSIGLQLSLPIVTTLLIANIALGILTKAAPQLNLFGIGFPITIGVGFLMLSINMPYWSSPIINSLDLGIQMIRQATATLAN